MTRACRLLTALSALVFVFMVACGNETTGAQSYGGNLGTQVSGGSGGASETLIRGNNGATGAQTAADRSMGSTSGAAGAKAGIGNVAYQRDGGSGGVTGTQTTADKSRGSTGGTAEANAGTGSVAYQPKGGTGACAADPITSDHTYQTASYTDGLRAPQDYLAGTVYYPTDGNPPYASVAIVPGFTAYQDSIAGWGPFLASHGVAVITIDTITPADLPPVREAALMDALETMKAENTRSGGPLSGKLDISRQGVMGWSMGGGGTLLAANDNPTLKSAISLAGWNPLGEYTNNKVPSLMFASLGDPLAGGQSQGFYDSIPDSTPKMMIEWPGFDHSVANDPTGMSGEVGRFGLSWQEVYLKGNECYRKYLKETPTGTTEFKSNQ